MIPKEDKQLVSSSPRICENDNCAAEINLNVNGFTLKCFIKGPNKNEEILYFYS